MADDQELTFAARTGDIHELARRLILIASSQHGAGQVAGHGGVEDDHVALLSLEIMDRADPDTVSQVGLLDEVLEEPDLVPIGRNEADARERVVSRVKGLLRQSNGQRCMIVVPRRPFVVFFDPGLPIGGVDERKGFTWERGQGDQGLTDRADVTVGAIGEASASVQSGRERRDVRMHAVLSGQGGNAGILIVVDSSKTVNIGRQPVFGVISAGFGDRRKLEKVADDEHLPPGEAECGEERRWRGHRPFVDDHDIEAFAFHQGCGIGPGERGGDDPGGADDLRVEPGEVALTGGQREMQRTVRVLGRCVERAEFVE